MSNRVGRRVPPSESAGGERERSPAAGVLRGWGRSSRCPSNQDRFPGIEGRMEYRQLGNSGLKVPVLSFGTGTFGGANEFFKAWGSSDVAEASRLVDICLDAGVNLFDTADIYSDGMSEEILGKAIAGKRNRLLISTKATFRMGEGPNDLGSSRYHLVRSCENSLRRMGIETIDIYHMHGFDALTPVEETLKTLDTLVGKRKGALHRLFQFFRLAPDEIADGFRTLRLVAVCRPPGVLLASWPRV